MRDLRRGPWSPWLGSVALFSGAALLAHILGGFSLRLAWLFAASLAALGVGWRLRALSASERSRLLRLVRVALVTGVVATAAYDVSRWALSQLEPSPYNPFEALRIFGLALAGAGAPAPVIFATGSLFHAVNGLTFALAYCFLFGQRGLWAGMAWGLFLESFQLALYPGWLSIGFLREFAQISATSHLVYGACLGVGCRIGIQRLIALEEGMTWT